MPISASAAFAVFIALAPGLALAQSPASLVPGRQALHSPAARRLSRGFVSARMPGFETLADGSSRLFVELSSPITYDTKISRGSVTYVLKGARVLRRNNTNPLITLHFNTPVTSARLVPHGRDVWFVVALRADVQPAVSMDAGKDGGMVMHIALPGGAYLHGSTPSAANAASMPPASAATSAASSAGTDPSN